MKSRFVLGLLWHLATTASRLGVSIDDWKINNKGSALIFVAVCGDGSHVFFRSPSGWCTAPAQSFPDAWRKRDQIFFDPKIFELREGP